MKRTAWIDNNQAKPVRPGVYEVEWSESMGGIWFNHWDGKRWNYGSCNVGIAAQITDPVEPEYRRLAKRWRGVMRPNCPK